jgi:Fur family peroxide stress response transcriptional regulator
LTNRNYSYIVAAMKKINQQLSSYELEKRVDWFAQRCRQNGLKVTPQRIAIYKELLRTKEHPSAEVLYRKVKKIFPNISLDTVNRTLLTLSEIGAAFVVEGSGQAKRYDAGSEEHQHFKCIKCKRIIDFHHKPFDEIRLPAFIDRKYKVLRKTVYIEGLCDLCR